VVVRPRSGTTSSIAGSGAIVGGASSAGVISGRVLDESGTPLGGVVVLTVNARTNVPVSATLTARSGAYRLVTVAGANRVTAVAPGLKLKRAHRPTAEALDLVLAIDLQAERIVVRNGRTWRFDMNASEWPEILPPPEVRAALRFEYNIDIDRNFCPGDLLLNGKPSPDNWDPRLGIYCTNPTKCPASAWQRQCRVPKYWWLRLLEQEPPTPGRPACKMLPGEPCWWKELMAEMQAAELEAREAASR
jgi:hypothetical protein